MVLSMVRSRCFHDDFMINECRGVNERNQSVSRDFHERTNVLGIREIHINIPWMPPRQHVEKAIEAHAGTTKHH